MNDIKKYVVVVVMLFAINGWLGAQVKPAKACARPESRQFDFWIGEWTVTSGGQVVGSNTITPIMDGCVLQENWVGASGNKGSSFNYYNPNTKKWNQYWVYQNGTPLPLLVGGYKDGKMVLTGRGTARDGKPVLHRITWHNNGDGTVRQHWQTSKDEGKSWSTAFDGAYTKKK